MTGICVYRMNPYLSMIQFYPEKEKVGFSKKKTIATITGSHSKTIIFGTLSLDGKQLFRQYDRFDSQTFIVTLKM